MRAGCGERRQERKEREKVEEKRNGERKTDENILYFALGQINWNIEIV